MIESYAAITSHFETILDYIRFGISQAHAANIHYGHGTDNAEDDFFLLILRSLSLPLDIDPLLLQGKLTAHEKQTLANKLSQRILDRIPVPYLIQEAFFCDLSFYVDQRVLIPRSPIAELIKQQFTPWLNPDKVNRILDLCTGSACIAIACTYAFPEAKIDAADISEEALEVAAINRYRHHLEESLTLIQSDCWEQVPQVRYDLIVSNPPYVSEEEMKTLPPEYEHEPQLALETANKGLAVVEKILNHAHKYLTEGGILVVEVGNTEEALIEAYPNIPFTWLEFEHGGQGVFLLTRQQLEAYFAKE